MDKEQQQGVLDDGIDPDISQDTLQQDTLCGSCGQTFMSIGKLLRQSQFYLPLIFFIIQGVLIPNFDDLHYVFIIEVIGMTKFEYDFLNTITYAAMLIFICIYNFALTGIQVWKLVLTSLLLFLFMTTLMLINALRLNADYGVSDSVINAFIFFFGTQSVMTIAFVPM